MRNYSLNNSELNKFKRTRQEWQNPTGEFHSLHAINPIRTRYIKMKIKEHFNITDQDFNKLKLIDVGCGGGLVCENMYESGLNVTGLDINLDPDFINRGNTSQTNTSQKNSSSKNDTETDTVNDVLSDTRNNAQNNTRTGKNFINYLATSLEEYLESAPEYESEYALNSTPNSSREYASKYAKKYDIVLCLEVIEHIDNQQDFINNLTKLLKPDGMMIISTVNKTIKSWFLAIMAAEYICGFLPKGTHDYNKFLKPSKLSRMLSNSSRQIKELTGLSLGLPLRNWHLSSDIAVNYFAVIK